MQIQAKFDLSLRLVQKKIFEKEIGKVDVEWV